ncbi:MAG: S41 family peptidase [Synechococcaceae cyanobacterium]|nr:S41 family peptidase [Synechococcaceae cyanobacterium]
MLLGLLLTLALISPTPVDPALALSDAQQLVVDAWRLVNQSYVDPQRLETIGWKRLRQKTLERPISSSQQAWDAIEAMLMPIGDPYTRMLRPAEFASLQSNTRGRVSGVGLQLALREGKGAESQAIVVIAPLDGSPAAAAGIVSGSEVLQVDGSPVADLGLEGTAARLRGPAGSDVLVRLRTPGGRERELLLERREVDLRPVRASQPRIDGHRLGVLRITQFSEPVPAQVREALEGFRQDGVEGVLLDLRNNSGGLVSAGLAVANGLLDGEPIVETHDRGGLGAREQAGAGTVWDGPLLTLVNGGTASASEILAGALQDAGRSELVGNRTFGKGLIQTLIPLGDGSGLAVTVARYRTPSGRDIQAVGIEPDRRLAGEEPLNPGGLDDRWLEQAERELARRLERAGHP